MSGDSQDPIEMALQEIEQGRVSQGQTTQPVSTEQTTQPVSTEQTTQPVSTEQTTQSDIVWSDLPVEKQLNLFNELTGLNINNLDEVKEYSSVYSQLPDFKKQIDLYPQLLDRLKQTTSISEQFYDETAYKVNQIIIKNPDLKGKESLLNQALRSNLTELKDLDILKISAGIDAPQGVVNPLRAKLSMMGVDVDEALNNYSELSQDDKDKIAMFAGTARKDLSKLSEGIELPESPVDFVAQIEKEQNDAKQALDEKRNKLLPIGNSIVDEVKELKIDDTFNFQLQLTPDEKQAYSEFISEAILAGEFDISKTEGKQQLYAALMDEMFLDKKTEIIAAIKTSVRNQVEEEMRAKYDNEKDLKHQEQHSGDEGKEKSKIVELAEKMVDESQ